jgi:hypothetical protein
VISIREGGWKSALPIFGTAGAELKASDMTKAPDMAGFSL